MHSNRPLPPPTATTNRHPHVAATWHSTANTWQPTRHPLATHTAPRGTHMTASDTTKNKLATPLLFLGGVARMALCAAGPGRSTALNTHSGRAVQTEQTHQERKNAWIDCFVPRNDRKDNGPVGAVNKRAQPEWTLTRPGPDTPLICAQKMDNKKVCQSLFVEFWGLKRWLSTKYSGLGYIVFGRGTSPYPLQRGNVGRGALGGLLTR
jgi:hypothetical protein